ncbi:MAG: BON domain-containing protein [Myxococcaceae bacterium]|nr:BON domain-containing protein [Myxococcaceae bacterium]
MDTVDSLLTAVREALAREPRLDLQRYPIRLWWEWNDLGMAGELPDVASKKLALERAAAVPGVDRIIDQLHVIPDRRLPDDEVLEHVCRDLSAEPALQPFTLRARVGKQVRTWRDAGPKARGAIEIRVEDGVVTLDGDVTGLGHKRLAGVLAWWVPGVRDVVNGMGVSPREQDTDGEMADGVRLALEKDPLVSTESVSISSRSGVVTLSGAVGSEEAREAAERDAWCVWGVDRVVNRLEISAR